MGKTVTALPSGVVQVQDAPSSPGAGRHDFTIQQGEMLMKHFQFLDSAGINRTELIHHDLRFKMRLTKNSGEVIEHVCTFPVDYDQYIQRPLILTARRVPGELIDEPYSLDREIFYDFQPEDYDDIPHGHAKLCVPAMDVAAYSFNRAYYDLEAVELPRSDANTVIDLSAAITVTIDVDEGGAFVNKSKITDTNPTGSFANIKPKDIIAISGLTGVDESKNGEYFVYSLVDISNIRITRKLPGSDAVGLTPTLEHHRYCEVDVVDHSGVTVSTAGNDRRLTAGAGTPFGTSCTRNGVANFSFFLKGCWTRFDYGSVSNLWGHQAVQTTMDGITGFFRIDPDGTLNNTVMDVLGLTVPDGAYTDMLIARCWEDKAERLLEGIITLDKEVTR